MTNRLRALVVTAMMVSATLLGTAALAQEGTDRLASDLATVDVVAVDSAVAAELADPRYRLGAPWWERIVEFLERAWIRFLEWAFEISQLVGGPIPLALIIGGVVVAVAVAVTANLGRRRAQAIEERLRREHRESRGLDPADLEEQAYRAEERGDHTAAFRLLFRAALLRLDERGLIDLRPGSTSGTVASQLGSEEFGRLVMRFDEIVYGGREARPEDPVAVRSVLSHLLGRVRA